MWPMASTADPENAAGPVCANARNPAIGSVMPTSTIAATTPADRVSGARLRRAFNMKLTLRSRLDGRAIAGAGDQTARCRLNVRARSTNSLAYSVPCTPRFSTASSQACSLSRRRRLHAIHSSGLNQ